MVLQKQYNDRQDYVFLVGDSTLPYTTRGRDFMWHSPIANWLSCDVLTLLLARELSIGLEQSVNL